MSLATDSCAEIALPVRLLSENARLPAKGSSLAAGFDLFASVDGIVPANGGRLLIPLDISIAVPVGYYGRVAPRSGLAVKHGIDVGAGVIDADYRGNVGVILFNFGANDFVVNKGDRIAQLILERIALAEAVQVDVCFLSITWVILTIIRTWMTLPVELVALDQLASKLSSLMF